MINLLIIGALVCVGPPNLRIVPETPESPWTGTIIARHNIGRSYMSIVVEPASGKPARSVHVSRILHVGPCQDTISVISMIDSILRGKL